MNHPDPGARAVAQTVSGWQGAPWLCPLTPPGLASADTPLRFVFHDHTGSVEAVAVSPDNQLVVSASRDETVRVWNLHSGRLVRTLKGHTDWVRAVAVSPDNQLVVSGDDDETVRVWELHSGRLVRTLKGHTGWGRYKLLFGRLVRILKDDTDSMSASVNAVAVSPDNQLIVSGDDETVRVWELHSGRLVRTLQDHAGWVQAVAVSPDNQLVVSGEYKMVRVWELHSGRLVRTLQGHTGRVGAVAVSPDNQLIVSAANDKTVRVWNLHGGQELAQWTGDYHIYISAPATVSTGPFTIAVGDLPGTVYTLQLRGFRANSPAETADHPRNGIDRASRDG
jgi:WD40 repeat protein